MSGKMLALGAMLSVTLAATGCCRLCDRWCGPRHGEPVAYQPAQCCPVVCCPAPCCNASPAGTVPASTWQQPAPRNYGPPSGCP
jgi:hypothetical protein